MATRYDDCRLETESETRSLNAVVDPRMIRESSKEIIVVTRMDRIGRAVRGSTLTKRGSASRLSKGDLFVTGNHGAICNLTYMH